jgi:hypothetical protein
MICATVEATGTKCPKYDITNTDKQNGMWYCYDCGYD